MVSSISIKNYKSILDAKVDLKRINVVIGENGAGKSNFLEAITLASAASQYKLNNEFLSARGIRVTSPKFMRSAFNSNSLLKDITLNVTVNETQEEYKLSNDNSDYSEWYTRIKSEDDFLKLLTVLSKNAALGKKAKEKNLINPEYSQLLEKLQLSDAIKKLNSKKNIPDFVIYSPEESKIRNFESEGQILPLGRNGEGLLKLISTIYNDGDQKKVNQLKDNLKLINWFEDFEFLSRPFEKEAFLKIKDKYIDSELEYLDQRSSNEGFLYLLFYLTLFISDKTSNFFAIDNIDNSLNPKLCIKLIQTITKLAKENNKQVIFTTHNPAVLDGLDLTDDEQQILVLSRKKTGETKIVSITEKPKSDMKLSESFMSGLLGGLPKNF